MASLIATTQRKQQMQSCILVFLILRDAKNVERGRWTHKKTTTQSRERMRNLNRHMPAFAFLVIYNQKCRRFFCLFLVCLPLHSLQEKLRARLKKGYVKVVMRFFITHVYVWPLFPKHNGYTWLYPIHSGWLYDINGLGRCPYAHKCETGFPCRRCCILCVCVIAECMCASYAFVCF